MTLKSLHHIRSIASLNYLWENPTFRCIQGRDERPRDKAEGAQFQPRNSRAWELKAHPAIHPSPWDPHQLTQKKTSPLPRAAWRTSELMSWLGHDEALALTCCRRGLLSEALALRPGQGRRQLLSTCQAVSGWERECLCCPQGLSPLEPGVRQASTRRQAQRGTPRACGSSQCRQRPLVANRRRSLPVLLSIPL